MTASAYPHLAAYHDELQRIRSAGGSTELHLRPAFYNCLSRYCLAHPDRLALIHEDTLPGGRQPDGVVKEPATRLIRGCWEAKDPDDDLEAEIRSKIAAGYPTDNILFEDSRTAVLFQNGQRVMQANMLDYAELDAIIVRFLAYESLESAGPRFRRAQSQFKGSLASVLQYLRPVVDDAVASNPAYQQAAADFLNLCHQTIGPQVTPDDVREMILQHILTKDVFNAVFYGDSFHNENNIARELDALGNILITRAVRMQALDRLRPYYEAIAGIAARLLTHADRQQFLKTVYEDFYQAYNPAAADRQGVIYTPNPIVDFIIKGADFLLRQHFGRGLDAENVNILDPATGTGAFVTGLIQHLPLSRLEFKYRNEIFANEVSILPYYIANLNIEYTYYERTRYYVGFPNLSFVDTLDNTVWRSDGESGPGPGESGPRQAAMFGGLSDANLERIRQQNEKPLSVIIGNPPYNDNAVSWGDGTANREYPYIDRRIRATYVARSSAQRSHQYDMYKRFLRWASDRLADDGIIAFVTNRSYLDSRNDDGFRQVTLEEFSDLYVVDLGGDLRRSMQGGPPSGGNVFNIMAGVAIGFFVRNSAAARPGKVHYYAVADALSGADKLAALSRLNPALIDFTAITPDARHNWLRQTDAGFDALLPVANKQTKFAKTRRAEQALFRRFANAAKSNRDDWVYDFDERNLRQKAQFFIDTYNELLAQNDRSYHPVIKWSSTLRDLFLRGQSAQFDESHIITAHYRPFVVKSYCAYSLMNDRLTRNHYEMFGADLRRSNQVINFCVSGKDFYVLATDAIADFHFTGDTQCLPRYCYTDAGQRVSNITEWGLRQFREHYGNDDITAADVFAYTYAALHRPAYRRQYAVELRREFPRLPFYPDFPVWTQLGRELLDCHLNFASAAPWELQRQDKPRVTRPRPLLKADPAQGHLILDRRTTLTGVPEAAWQYRLGARSALEWALDQYRESRNPRDKNVRERFRTHSYRFADHKERVIELLQRVCAVSVRTMDIVDRINDAPAG